MTLAFTVPGDPIPLARPRVVRGHTYTEKRSKDYQRLVADHARLAGAVATEDELAVALAFYRATARRCDIDNLTKNVLDGLMGVAFEDDAQIVKLTAEKRVDRERPRTEVWIESVESVEDDLRRRKALLSVVSPGKRAAVLTKRLTPSKRDYGEEER